MTTAAAPRPITTWKRRPGPLRRRLRRAPHGRLDLPRRLRATSAANSTSAATSRAHRPRRRREHPGQGREPLRPPPEPGVLRLRAPSARSASSRSPSSAARPATRDAIEGDLTIKGITRRVVADRHWTRDRGRHHRLAADRHRPRDDDRPHRVRAELERPAAQGRLRARQRRRRSASTSSSFRRRRRAMRILGISGSLRAGSHNTRLLRQAAQPAAGRCRVRAARPRRAARHPALRRGRARGRRRAARGDRAARRRSRRRTASSSRRPSTTARSPASSRTRSTGSRGRSPQSPFKGKDVAVVGASTGMFGAVWAQAELRKVLVALGARVVDRELPLMQADEAWAADGSLADDELTEQLRRARRTRSSARSRRAGDWRCRRRRSARRARGASARPASSAGRR